MSMVFTYRNDKNNNLKSTTMGLFNFFSKKENNGKTLEISLPNEQPAPATDVVKYTAPAATTDETQQTNNSLTVSYATGWPIDVVYGYLRKNYEEKGFEDAMVKSDMAFRDMNMNLIRNKILIVFREVNLNYDVMKRDLQVRMDNCNAAGLMTTVSELSKSMQLIDLHKEELKQLEHDFRNNVNEASIPLQSYECGFLRGIATVSLAGNKTAVSIPMPSAGDYQKSEKTA